MDRELTFQEIAELAKQPAIRVREDFLQSLGRGLSWLAEQSVALPPAIHSVVRIKDLRTVREGLAVKNLSVEELLFWSELQKVSANSDDKVGLSRALATPDLWAILEVSESDALLLERLGFSPDDYLTCLGTDSMNSQSLMKWISSEIPTKDVRSWVLSGVPNPETAIEWMRELREIAEYVMINYRNFRGDLYRAKTWRLRAAAQTHPRDLLLTSQPIIRAPQPPVAVPTELVQAAIFPSRPHHWLEEIIARARTLQPLLRKVPHWPARFEYGDEGLIVVLEQFPRVLKGVVTVKSQRRWCEFSPTTFEIMSRCDTGEDRFVVGMSICWFIDCSITIHQPSRGSPNLFTAESISDPKEQRKPVRYIPTATFRARSNEARSSASKLIIRHKVSGHVRKLPPGRRGSEHARSNAPDHIRRSLRKSETYVEPHFRGTEAEKAELATRLSRYSALGEALSGTDWA